MSDKRRVFRVGERVRDLVASELQKVADPRFNLVTITSVVVSPDLRLAKIYWVVTGGGSRIAEVKEAFEGAKGLFKRAVGSNLGLKFAPDLKFYYDETLDAAQEVESLFARVRAHDEACATTGDKKDECSE